MATRAIEFDPEDALKLLVHYSNGKVPLDGRIIEFGFNPQLWNYLGFRIETNEDGPPMIHVRYEGRKVMTYDERGKPIEWKGEGEGFETPRRG